MNIDCSKILTAAKTVFTWYRKEQFSSPGDEEQFSGCLYYIYEELPWCICRYCPIFQAEVNFMGPQAQLGQQANIFRICFYLLFKHQKDRVSPSRTPWQYLPLKESIAISCFVSLLSYFLVSIKNVILSDTLQKSPAKNIGAFCDRYPAAYCNMMGLLYCFFKMGYWRI